MTRFPIEEFSSLQTPFYFYDLKLLDRTLKEIKRTARDSRFKVHYAIKANANPAYSDIYRRPASVSTV